MSFIISQVFSDKRKRNKTVRKKRSLTKMQILSTFFVFFLVIGKKPLSIESHDAGKATLRKLKENNQTSSYKRIPSKANIRNAIADVAVGTHLPCSGVL